MIITSNPITLTSLEEKFENYINASCKHDHDEVNLKINWLHNNRSKKSASAKTTDKVQLGFIISFPGRQCGKVNEIVKTSIG